MGSSWPDSCSGDTATFLEKPCVILARWEPRNHQRMAPSGPRRTSLTGLHERCNVCKFRSTVCLPEGHESEGGRRVDPEEHRFFARRVVPAMTDIALEPEAVALAQRMALELVEPEFQGTRHHVDEFLALVRVRSIAAGTRLHADQHAFELFRADRQQLNLHAGLRLDGAPVANADKT